MRAHTNLLQRCLSAGSIAILAMAPGCSAEIDQPSAEASDVVIEPSVNFGADIDKVRDFLELIESEYLLDADGSGDWLEVLAREKPSQFVSALLGKIGDSAEERARLEGMAQGVGYETLSDFEKDGNAVFQAISVLTFKKGNPKIFREISETGEAGRAVWSANEEFGAVSKLIYTVPDNFVEKVAPFYDFFVVDRGNLSPEQSPELESYYGYMALFSEFVALIPEPDKEAAAALNASFIPARPMSSLLPVLGEFFPTEMELISVSAPTYGFASVEEWALVGDRVQLAMNVLAFTQNAPERLDEIRSRTDEDIAHYDAEAREHQEVVRTITDVEWAYFKENFDRFLEIISAQN